MLKIVLFVCAWIAFALGAVGVFVPVLPTTPFILLAAFLFAKSSPRCDAWLKRTWIYRSYVTPFLEQGGIPLKRKIHILGISLLILGVSAFLARSLIVWVILGAVAVFLLWLVCIRIPTVQANETSELNRETGRSCANSREAAEKPNQS